jgi:hypothetical protein
MLVFLAYLSMVSVLIPLIQWVRFNKQDKRSQLLKAILVYLLTSLVFDLLVYGFGKMGKSSTLIVNLFFILQFYLLSYMYAVYLKKSSMISLSVFGFTLFVIINSIFFQPFSQIQSWSDGLQSVLLIIYAVTAHLHLLEYPAEDEYKDSMFFWVNMAFMFYFSLNLYVFITSSYVIGNESAEIGLIFWSFHNCFNIIKNVLIGVGFYHIYTKVVKF